jgi:hypothetical protein
MANKLTVRFYLVQKFQPNSLSLKQALARMAALDFPEHERTLTAGLMVRLERYAEDAGELTGELTRVRTGTVSRLGSVLRTIL